MRVKSLAQRILKQLSHDKRTIGLMFVVPLLLLTLIYYIFEGTEDAINIGVVNPSEMLIDVMESNDNTDVSDYESWDLASDALEANDVVAIVDMSDFRIMINGSAGAKAGAAERMLTGAIENINREISEKQALAAGLSQLLDKLAVPPAQRPALMAPILGDSAILDKGAESAVGAPDSEDGVTSGASMESAGSVPDSGSAATLGKGAESAVGAPDSEDGVTSGASMESAGSVPDSGSAATLDKGAETAGSASATGTVATSDKGVETAGSASTTGIAATLSGTEAEAADGLIRYEIEYLDGIKDIRSFDLFGSTLMGFLTFFFVFLVAGMAFLKERKSGTLEKLISTPIRRWEIVLGYTCGFGLITVLQSTVISLFIVKVLGIMMHGSIWYVLLIMFLTAICALTLGMLLSTAANSEFQMMQFIPIVVIPQLFFSGLFDLSDGWMLFGKILPLTYIADALNKILLSGAGIDAFYIDVMILAGFSAVFMGLNVLLLKRYRRI